MKFAKLIEEFISKEVIFPMEKDLERERIKVVMLEYEVKNLKEQLSYLRNAEHDREGGKH